MALLYHCWCHCDSCRSGTLGLANAFRHTGQIYDQQWAKWQLWFRIMRLFEKTEELFLSLLSAARCHLKDNCPAGHFTHCGTLHPSNSDIFIELSDTWICLSSLHHISTLLWFCDWFWLGKRGEKSHQKWFLIFIFIWSEAFLSCIAHTHIQKNKFS